jgi:arsenite methyltransferase
VLGEMFRVLRRGGRIGISDVVAADGLDEVERQKRGSFVGCIAGAMTFAEYSTGLMQLGFIDVAIDVTHELADEIYGANIKATKP